MEALRPKLQPRLMLVLGLLIFTPQISVTAQDTNLAELQKKILANIDSVRACTVVVGRSGSGVVISEDGYVLSCAHITKAAGRNVTITLANGKRVNATTLGNHHNADASVLKIDTPGKYAFAPMAKSSEVSVGDWVLAVGYPVTFSKNKPPPVRIGRITRKFKTQVRSDAPIMGGDSGGPLFNLKGEVIGISSKVSEAITSNIHVAIDEFHKNWDRLLASEDWGRPQESPKKRKPKATTSNSLKAIGIEKLTNTPTGPMVKVLVVDSAAWKSGIRNGHVLLRIGNQDVSNIQQANAALSSQLKSHSPIDVIVGRKDQNHGRVTLQLWAKE